MSWPRRFFGKVLGSRCARNYQISFLSEPMIWSGFGLASDPEAVPKRSELARSAVGADSDLQVGALRDLAAITLIADSILQ